MNREHWATFSIYDYAKPLYKQALVLFDRVVIPVPSRPFKKITKEELERVEADVTWLVNQGVALRFDWDPDKFDDWKHQFLGAAAAHRLEEITRNQESPSVPYAGQPVHSQANVLGATGSRGGQWVGTGDAELDTRYQLIDEIEKGSIVFPDCRDIKVTAVPVVGASEELTSLPPEYLGALQDQSASFEILLNQMPLPAETADLGAICDLRESKVFKAALTKMRKWQVDLTLELLHARSNPAERELVLEGAKLQLIDWVNSYRMAMEGAELDKHHSSLKAVAALGSVLLEPAKWLVELLKAGGEGTAGLFSLATRDESCWKRVHGEEFALAGVICGAERALKAHGSEVHLT